MTPGLSSSREGKREIPARAQEIKAPSSCAPPEERGIRCAYPIGAAHLVEKGSARHHLPTCSHRCPTCLCVLAHTVHAWDPGVPQSLALTPYLCVQPRARLRAHRRVPAAVRSCAWVCAHTVGVHNWVCRGARLQVWWCVCSAHVRVCARTCTRVWGQWGAHMRAGAPLCEWARKRVGGQRACGLACAVPGHHQMVPCLHVTFWGPKPAPCRGTRVGTVPSVG